MQASEEIPPHKKEHVEYSHQLQVHAYSQVSSLKFYGIIAISLQISTEKLRFIILRNLGYQRSNIGPWILWCILETCKCIVIFKRFFVLLNQTKTLKTLKFTKEK
jgi:hypothetical protein